MTIIETTMLKQPTAAAATAAIKMLASTFIAAVAVAKTSTMTPASCPWTKYQRQRNLVGDRCQLYWTNSQTIAASCVLLPLLASRFQAVSQTKCPRCLLPLLRVFAFIIQSNHVMSKLSPPVFRRKEKKSKCTISFVDLHGWFWEMGIDV